MEEEEQQQQTVEEEQPQKQDEEQLQKDEEEQPQKQQEEPPPKQEEEKPQKPEKYEITDLKSKPKFGPEEQTEKFNEKTIELINSFGYQCIGSPNICFLDKKTALIAAGSTMILLDIASKRQRYLPTVSGGGIGHMVAHPNKKHFAVAEKGNEPYIVFFTYPQLELYKMLQGGTELVYCFIQFNPEGDLLASIGGAPDYSLTVWKWESEAILLRVKAFAQDVYTVKFSQFLLDQLATTGLGHIRFWKMAKSFTGLKLQGDIGKFGKLEISDIHGCVHMPDGNVLSGSEWGIILIWEGDLVKAQVRLTNGKPCHQGVIHQLILGEGELVTVGADGWIKVWDLENIENADPEEEADFVEFDPLNELLISKDSHLICMIPSASGKEKDIWYAQDKNGAIWKIDMSFGVTAKPPTCVLSCPGIRITGMDMCPSYPLLGVSAMDGTVTIFDCISNEKFCSVHYDIGATSFLWPNTTLDGIGASVFAGFEDGTLRWFSLVPCGLQKYKFLLRVALRPHSVSITCLSINESATVLLSYAFDRTLFVFQISEGQISPTGYVNLEHYVNWIMWTPSKEDSENVVEGNSVLLGCDQSCILKMSIPDPTEFKEDRLTYLIKDVKLVKYRVESMKDYYELAYPEEEVEEEAEEEGEEEELADEEEVEEGEPPPPTYDILETIVIEEEPAEPPEILHCFRSDQPGHIWLSLGEKDTGFLFEFPISNKPDVEEVHLIPTRAVELWASDKKEVLSTCISPCGHYIFMGQKDGVLSVYRLSEEYDLCTPVEYWKYAFHDSFQGSVRFVCLSHDGRLIASAGEDNNIFLYKFNVEEYKKKRFKPVDYPVLEMAEGGEDIIGEDVPNIEMAFQKEREAEYLERMKHLRESIASEIFVLTDELKKLRQQSEAVLPSEQLNFGDVSLHSRVQADLERRFEDDIRSVQNETAWEFEYNNLAIHKLVDKFKKPILHEKIVVKSFSSDKEVSSYRICRLPKELIPEEQIRKPEDHEVEAKVKEGQKVTLPTTKAAGLLTTVKFSDEFEWPPEMPKTKEQEKYEERRRARSVRKVQWDELNACQPPEECDVEDDEMLKHAKLTLGDFKLKTDEDYAAPHHLRMNAAQKREQILNFYQQIHQRKLKFSEKVFGLRDQREELKDVTSENENDELSVDDHENADGSDSSSTMLHKLTERNAAMCQILKEVKSRATKRTVSFFDSELGIWCRNQARFDVELKYSDARYVNMVQELFVLKKSDQEEKSLEDRISSKNEELNMLHQKVENYKSQIKDSEELVVHLNIENQENFKSFQKVLGEKNKYASFLTRLFRKKIRQARRERDDDDEEESESDESDSDDDDDYSSDEEASGKIITEADIDPVLLYQVNVHREKRQKIDDCIKEEQIAIGTAKKEKEAVVKKSKLVATALKNAIKEMENFQVKKQGELNRLDLVVLLFMSQIMAFDMSDLPEIFEQLSIHHSKALKKLRKRVIELQKESIQQKQQQRDVIKQFEQLNISCTETEVWVTRMYDLAHTQMMEKFGSMVSIEYLDDMENNPRSAVLKFRKEQMHTAQQLALQSLCAKLEEKKTELREETTENSRRTLFLVQLKEELNFLNRDLLKRRKILT